MTGVVLFLLVTLPRWVNVASHGDRALTNQSRYLLYFAKFGVWYLIHN